MANGDDREYGDGGDDSSAAQQKAEQDRKAWRQRHRKGPEDD